VTKRYDAATRTLSERHPEDWLPLVRLDRGLPVEVVDSNVSTVSAETDKVLKVGGPSPGIVHVEVQSTYDPSIPLRLLRYNVLLRARHDLPVLSAVVLLVPRADGPALTGLYTSEWPDAAGRVEFRYPVVRVCERSADDLAAAPGTLPLAILAARDEDEAARVLGPPLAAFHRPPTPDEREVEAACYVFAGLKFDRGLADRIFRGLDAMKESVTYQAILEEGREKGLRRAVLLQASQRFGPPDDADRGRLEAVTGEARLEALAARVLTAESWDDLLSQTA
jgi:predicted transposase YdaD